MRSAAVFTQPTVLTIHTSLRVPTRPFVRRYPANVGISIDPVPLRVTG
jgi:hypothetical protein